MGRQKKNGQQKRGKGMSAATGPYEDLDHTQRRKIKRREERLEKKLFKKRKLKGNNAQEAAEHVEGDKIEMEKNIAKLERESSMRKIKVSETIKIKYYEKAIKTLDHSLRFHRLYQSDDDEPKSKLKGAARPAREIYPEYYPEIYEKMLEREKTEDLLEKHQHNLANSTETFDYVRLKFLYGIRLLQFGQSRKALKAFKEIIEDLDSSSNCFKQLIVPRMVAIYINKGDLLEARKLLENEEISENDSFSAWDKFLIEYISCYILEEDTKENIVEELLGNAVKGNRNILKALLKSEEMEDQIDPYSIAEDEASSFEQYLIYDDISSLVGKKHKEEFVPFRFPEHRRYFHRSISWFRDAAGIFSYIKAYVRKNQKKSVE